MEFNTKSRSENALKNIIFGISSQILILITTFISRTIFIKQLGAEYLGVNGLYTDILAILSLAEMGMANVMLYSLYRPVAERDEAKIYAILNYYKKIYRIIALVILVIGLCLIPLLDTITNNSTLENKELIIFYILFLVNTIVSYFVAYKSALINVDQKFYVVQKINTITTLSKEALQIIFLLLANSYLLYLCILCSFTIINNYFISKKADRLYPFIKLKFETVKIDTRNIKENIKSMFIYRLGTALMNNTDAILISTMIGIAAVGYYSNYNLILSTVVMFIFMFAKALQSSIGNLNAEGNRLKSYEFFNTLVLFFNGLSTFCAITLFIVVNDFITIWLGESFLLEIDVVIAIIINFYIKQVMEPIGVYRQTMGLFSQVKYVVFITALLNLILSVILGIQWGFAGIMIATSISRILTTVWYEPMILYRLKFNQPISAYWNRQVKYIIISIIAAYLTILLTKDLEISIVFIMLKIVIVLVIVTVVFVITNYRSKEFKMLYGYLLGIVKK